MRCRPAAEADPADSGQLSADLLARVEQQDLLRRGSECKHPTGH